MHHDPLVPLTLPDAWPYPGRPAQRPLACREGRDLPGLGPGWRVCAPAGDVDLGPAEALPGAFGRGGILRAGDAVLRPYRRGGLVRFVNQRTYRTSIRFAAEYAIHRSLWEAGFPTVEPLGYAWRPHRWGVEGVFITRFAAGEPWPRRWDLSARLLPDLDRALGALCAWGLWSPDLNATNILLPPDGGLLLMDWDRARFAPSADLRSRYDERLRRSLRKLGAPREAFPA